MFNIFKKKAIEAEKEVIEQKEDNNKPGFFSTEILPEYRKGDGLKKANAISFQRTAADFKPVQSSVAMDESISSVKSQFSINNQIINDVLLGWYGSQGFIGYQTCAIIAQHWLVDKACTMPARDAIRNGYEITVNDGSKIDVKILDEIKKADVKYRLNENLVQFVRMGRIYGIRIAMFKIESNDDDFYEKPFNIDGVTQGSYKGIVQIDPYWITPEFDFESLGDPSSLYFYEPTWWRVNGKRIHRSHLIIMRTSELPDILKPTYFYGGVPVPQRIYERVYAAERTANEAPLLALTKRSTVVHTDIEKALANQAAFEGKMALWSNYMNNYAIKVLGDQEEAQQFDTSLTDLDNVIMTQYQIVAAAANVPAVKLLGTSPKGFNATGEYEERSYHEELKTIQTNDFTPLIERHHMLLIKSEIAPQAPFETSVVWNPLDSTTSKGKAENNKLKAETGKLLIESGAISPDDERQRLINDSESGYNGMSAEPEIENDPESGSELGPEIVNGESENAEENFN